MIRFADIVFSNNYADDIKLNFLVLIHTERVAQKSG